MTLLTSLSIAYKSGTNLQLQFHATIYPFPSHSTYNNFTKESHYSNSYSVSTAINNQFPHHTIISDKYSHKLGIPSSCQVLIVC